MSENEVQHEEHETPCQSCGGCSACQCKCVCDGCGATNLVMGEHGLCLACEPAAELGGELAHERDRSPGRL